MLIYPNKRNILLTHNIMGRDLVRLASKIFTCNFQSVGDCAKHGQ